MTTKKTSPINSQDLRELKNKLHHLKPIVIIDNNMGLSDAVFQEIEQALNEHELIKIRTHTNTREDLNILAEAICAKTKASIVQTIGYIIAIYRKNLIEE